MRKAILIMVSAILMAGTAWADVKVKTKQTMSGQSSENTTYIKGKRQRTEMMGGVMVSITQCDLAQDLQLNPQTKTYMVTKYADGTTSEPRQVNADTKSQPVQKGGVMNITTTIKDTGERKQMFGYTARHIIQTIETESTPDSCLPTKSKMEMDMWVIDAEWALQCSETRKYAPYQDGKAGGCRDRIEQKTIGSAKSGWPVYQKMTSTDARSGQTFTMEQEVVEFSKATLDPSLFEAPADYREVKDSAALYASASSSSSSSSAGGYKAPSSGSPAGSYSAPSSGIQSSIQNANSSSSGDQSAVSAKKAGTIRIGVSVKTTAVGEGITANDLSNAVQNSLGQYLKGTKVEVVPLEAKLAAAVPSEAKEKECDFILFATVAHKKGGGGGGFGFGKMLAQTVGQTGIGHTGSVAGNIAGQVATNVIVTAGSLSENVKSKDELTLDVNVKSAADNSNTLTKQFKAKAKSDGDDIISAVIEQAATALVETLVR